MAEQARESGAVEGWEWENPASAFKELERNVTVGMPAIGIRDALNPARDPNPESRCRLYLKRSEPPVR